MLKVEEVREVLMANAPDYYEVLQVHPKASHLMIKKAYRTLLLAGGHPDLGGPEQATQILNEAYATLSDPDRRLAYDRRRGTGREKPQTIYISMCPHCGVYNRVLSETRLLIARCGKCSKPLGKPGAPDKVKDAPMAKRRLSLIVAGVVLAVGVLVGGGYGVWVALEPRDSFQEAADLEERGQFSGAIERLQAMLAIDPRNVAARMRLGLVLEEQKKFGAAATEYTKATDLAPNAARGYFLLGRALMRTGKYKDAEPPLRRAIALDPQDVGSLVVLGNLLVRTDRTDEAIATYRRAIPMDVRNSDLYYNLGLVYRMKGDRDEAVEAFRQALSIEPSHREALLQLARMYHEKGSVQDALTQYQRAALLRYEDASVHYEMGELFGEAGDRPNAIRELRVALGQVSENPVLADRIQRALQRLGG